MNDLERVEVLEFRVPYRDIDMTGVMHRSVYVAHAEEAVAHFWRYRPPLEDEPWFDVTKIECRFFEPLRFDDTVRLLVTVDKIGMKSVGFNVRMETDECLAAEAEIIMGAFDRTRQEPVALPEDIRDWLYRYVD